MLMSSNHKPSSSRDSETIADQAAQWSDLLRHRDSRSQLREAFERWLAESPTHAETFERIDNAHALARAAGDSSQMAALERETLARVAARRRATRRRSFAIAAGLAAAVVGGLAVTGGSWHALRELPAQVRYAMAGDSYYSTDVGARRTVKLEDGSVLTLNTNTRVVVHFEPHTRGLTLLGGQALFEVAHDKTRPFIVAAGGHRVTAVGTAFDVRVTPQSFAVTMLEGRVAVQDEAAAAVSTDDDAASHSTRAAVAATSIAPVELAAGDQMVVDGAAPPVIHKADVERALSWREGQLIFRNDRLADAVAEVNRYSTRRIELSDDAVGNLRVSGIVNTGNTAVFVETMTNYYPVQVIESDRRHVVLGPRQG